MYFQIKEIILWSKNSNFKPRHLSIAPGKVNVITGASRTGKSAIIPIIDYCLGSEKCTIPVKTIRDASEWFGILVDTQEGQKLLARREPGLQKATGDMFVLEGPQITIPDRIPSKNASADAVKHSLDELAGLTALDFDVESIGSGFKARPSFRDFGAFIFQPQNLVANPNILFYKADTYEHREKLRTIFPYILNAITPDLLARQHELAQLRKELKRKQNELTNIKNVSSKWMAEIHARISEAKELGLIKEIIPTNATREHLIEILNKVVQSSSVEAGATGDTITEAVGELGQLQKEEAAASLEVSALRKRFAEMSALKDSAKEYQGALQVQRDRLRVSEWLAKLHDPIHNCPVCGNSLKSVTDQLNALNTSLEEIEKTAGEFSSVPAAFDREFERVRADLRTSTEKLQGIKIRIRALEKSSEEAKKQRYDSLRVSRFIGGLEQALKTYEDIGTDSDLSKEVEDLKGRVTELEKVISESQIKNKTKRALEVVNLNAGKLLPNLDVERPNDPISLSTDDLTITVRGVDREDYLWEIGSGSNWLSYHIAVSLALQQYFLSLTHSPIPSFIVYDQPSQVYFPKRLANRLSEEEMDPQLRDEDVEAVQKVFKIISLVIEASKGKLQAMVLDHAPDSVWGNIENVHLVEEWRGGKKLIPHEWIA